VNRASRQGRLVNDLPPDRFSSQGWIEPVDAEAKPLKEMRFATFNARAETAAEKPMFSRRLQAHALVSAAMAAAAVPRGRRGTHK
jgi:putative SOS response-associated peptidase YedK